MKTVRVLCISVTLIFAVTLLSVSAEAKNEKPVPVQLQEMSVLVRAGTSRGSGVLKATPDGRVWVLTCGHVVERLRKSREVQDRAGGKKSAVEFDDASVCQFVIENGRKVGEFSYDAEVIRYSPAERGEDLAALKVRSTTFKAPASARFYLDKALPQVGSDLYHCGSPLGEMGSNTLTYGILAQHGRLFEGRVYDQTTCPAMPGSSGGIVALKADGRYVGMVVRGASETFNLVVPVRRIREWARRVGVEFILDDSLEAPSDAELRKGPIEETS